MAYIPSLPTCEYYPRITTHFFLFGIVAYQQPRRPQARIPGFDPPSHPSRHPLDKVQIKDLSGLETSCYHLALARKVSSSF